ncbi:hypothetical protein MCBRY_001355 [Methylocystis bryophila]
MSGTREKFATQVDGEVLAAIRKIARNEGRQLQAVVEEALKALIEQRTGSRPREHVLAAYKASVPRYAALCEKPAK